MEFLPKTLWIGLLEQNQKEEIKSKLYHALKEQGKYDELEIDFIIQDGMDSRICDLENVIDIRSLELTKLQGGNEDVELL
jgi:hypothetical protein